MSWQQSVEQTVTGLGFDLVDIEKSAGGLLRVTIDLPWQAGLPAIQFVTVEDCERVTRQLQALLEVEGVEYRRLEVSSPGIDRPLRHELDFQRFVGSTVEITLKQPIGAAAAPAMAANRKKFCGVLSRADDGAWQIAWSDAPPRKPGQRVSKKAPPVPVQVMAFALDEIREARLAAVVNFKGRGAATALGL